MSRMFSPVALALLSLMGLSAPTLNQSLVLVNQAPLNLTLGAPGTNAFFVFMALSIVVLLMHRAKHCKAKRVPKVSEAPNRDVVQTQRKRVCSEQLNNTLTFVNDAGRRYFGNTREHLIEIRLTEPFRAHSQRSPVLYSLNPRYLVGRALHQV